MDKEILTSWPMKLLVSALLAVTLLTVIPYQGNITAFFHMDRTFSKDNLLPEDFVVLSVPGYDGAQYYQVARDVPKMVRPSHWKDMRLAFTPAYGFQRFLLPLAAFVLSLGQTPALPYAFLGINLLSLAVAGYLLLYKKAKPLYALALALSPAALVGLHFSLAEPLTIALLTLFLVRYERLQTLEWIDALILSGFVLAREVNVFFLGVLLLHVLLRKGWKELPILAVPVLVFFGLHGWIYAIFGKIPFLESGDKRTYPFGAIVPLLAGAKGYNAYTFSSIALFLGFVGPALAWVGWELGTKRTSGFLPWAALAFLALMTMMPDFIWGSITSIGRVITPVYPLFLLHAARRDTVSARFIAAAVLALGLSIGIGLAMITHRYTLT